MPINNCPHNRVQQYTECCLDCGRNIYESREEFNRYFNESQAESRRKKCPHNNIQEFTECCLDCGENIYG